MFNIETYIAKELEDGRMGAFTEQKTFLPSPIAALVQDGHQSDKKSSVDNYTWKVESHMLGGSFPQRIVGWLIDMPVTETVKGIPAL